MKNTPKRKKIIRLVIVFTIAVLVASIFVDVSFAGTPLESSTVICSADITNGGIWSYSCNENFATIYDGSNFEEPMWTVLIDVSFPSDEIIWPERAYCHLCRDVPYYISSTDYVMRIYRDGIDIYDKKSGETKNVWAAGHGQISLFATKGELCFAWWDVDVANWRTHNEKDGTYKFTFETGELEKLSEYAGWDLYAANKRMVVYDKFEIFQQIILIF